MSTHLTKTTLALMATCSIGVSQATTLEFNDFSSVAGLTLNEDAAQVGNQLQLTPPANDQSGSAWAAVDPFSSFSTRFQFQITSSGGFDDGDGVGADGIVFAVQAVSATVGGAGGGMGYSGIGNSFGVEFDTWNNPEINDINGNHVGIDINGNTESVTQTVISPRFNDGNIWTAWVDLNGALLEVRVSATGDRPIFPTLSYATDFAGLLGGQDAFVGFTAGTGGAYGDQRILNWEFESEPTGSVGVPEAGSSLVLLALGSLALGVCRQAGTLLRKK